MRKFLFVALSMVASLGLMGCGGPPSFNEIESQLNSPTLTLDGAMVQKSFQTYHHGHVAVSMPGLSKYGKMASFLVAGEGSKRARKASLRQYLLNSGIPSQFAERLAPYLPLNNDLSLRTYVKKEGKYSVLRQAFKAECVETRLNIGFLGTSGSFHYIIDLGCAGLGSGRIELKAEVQGSALSGKLRFSTRFLNACTLEKHCLNGSMIYKMEGSTNGSSASGSMLVSIYMVVTTSSDESVTVKQGMRIAFDTGKKAANLEALVFVKDADGKEGSAVVKLNVSEDQGNFSIRGSNGSFSCQATNGGKQGQCFAESNREKATFSW